jgi:sugar lactone lactonase YvrE
LLVHPHAIAFASRYAVDGEGILTIDRDGGVDVLCDFDDEPRGIAVDEHGRLYVAGAGGVSLLSAEGDRLGALRLSERPRSLAFAGDTLYIGGDTTLFQVRLTTKGAS